MMQRRMWFGTKDFATWLPMPSIAGYGATREGWSASQQRLDGGVNLRGSRSTHGSWILGFTNKSQAAVLPVLDFHAGLHGKGLIQWADPFAMEHNVLQRFWATPVLAAEGEDGIDVTTGGARPSAIPTPNLGPGFPTISALASSPAGGQGKRQLILIPPGHDLIVRLYGSQADVTKPYGMRVDTSAGSTLVPWTAPSDLNSSAGLRRIPGGASGAWAEAYYSSASGAVATIHGAMAQIVPEGSTPVWSRYISGRGHSGCEFDGPPTETPYSAALDLFGVSARLKETGAWR